MRARNIKPAFFKNEILAELPMATRLLFIGLWCMADREGRLEYRPLRIKAELFPYDSEDVRKHIRRLSEGGFVVCYEAAKICYLEISNFNRHQNPHKQEPPSRIPPSSEAVRKSIGSRRADSLLLIPDSPLLIPEVPKPQPGAADIPPFEKAWGQYPKRLGRKAAERHFKASVKTMQDWLDLQNALDNFKRKLRQDHTEDAYIPHGSTWFNNWRDYVKYGGVEYPKPPPPKPRPVEVPEPEMTEDEIIEMHVGTIKALGRCPTKECAICKKLKEIEVREAGSV